MNILVTGGAGYIGSHVVKQLLEYTTHSVTIVDNLSGGSYDIVSILSKLDKSKKRLTFYKEDLSNFEVLQNIFKENHFDEVIHFAASIVVSESVVNPLKYYMNNTLNTINLLNLCRTYNIKNFVFSSTAEVYGEPSELPITEETLQTPINPYGMSKLMSEQVIKDLSKAKKDFNYVIFRYFNVAGADMQTRIGECHEPETHLVPLIIHAVIGKRDKIYMYGDDYDTPDGSCVRDYVHVDDLADAHIKALDYLQEHKKSNIFNCGYGKGFSVKEVIDTVKKVSGVDITVEIQKRRDGDPAELVADNSKIIKEMGWQPKYQNLELICESALKWERKMMKQKTVIVGNGQIAKVFKNSCTIKNACVFASGVSNSSCTVKNHFQRERELLLKILSENKNKKFVYFSSCALSADDYSESEYYNHKKNMEDIVKENSSNYYIFRIPQLFGDFIPHETLINFIYESIEHNHKFNVYDEAYRYIIEIDDVKTLVENYLLHVDSCMTVDLANTHRYKVVDIVKIFEKLLDKKASYEVVEKEDKYLLDLLDLKSFIKENDIEMDFGKDYLVNKLMLRIEKGKYKIEN